MDRILHRNKPDVLDKPNTRSFKFCYAIRYKLSENTKMGLEAQIEEDLDTMFEYMNDNKLYSSMKKSLETCKQTYSRYQYWFNIWEEANHKQYLEGQNHGRTTN
jgi:hypothetical protein